MTPCLPTTYAADRGMACRPAPDAMLTIAPPPDRRNSGISCLMEKNVPVRSIRSTRSHACAVTSVSSWGDRRDGGVVDRQVQPATGLDGFLDGGADGVLVGGVGREGDRGTACRGDRLD